MRGHRCLPLLLSTVVLASFELQADDWPQWLGPKRDGVWRETGLLERFPAGGPPVRWRTPVGAGFSGPAVDRGRVFLTDHLLATDAKKPSNPFERGQIPGRERIVCLSETNGALLWKREYDCPYTVSYPSGPRATPLSSGDRLYTLGAEGHLHCLRSADGAVVWMRDLKKDYGVPTPLWGFAGHPLLDGQKLICLVGGAGTVAVAFDKDTGRELWRALTAKEPGYSPPTLIESGGQRQLILWHPESVNALNPETGELFWTQSFPVRNGLSVSTVVQAGNRLLLTSFYNGAMMLQLDEAKPGASVLWRSKKASEMDTDTLHSIIPTPFVVGGYIYGICSYGQLRCLKAETGERVWETFAATTGGKPVRWANAFLTRQGSRWLLFNEHGDLILARLSPAGYEEISRAHLLDPTNPDPGREVVWSPPAFANQNVYVRNDRELVSVSLAAPAH